MINNGPLSPPYRVYILDGHKFVTEILTHRLNSDSNIEVVGIGNKGGLRTLQAKKIPLFGRIYPPKTAQKKFPPFGRIFSLKNSVYIYF